jgi:hypothetical protein
LEILPVIQRRCFDRGKGGHNDAHIVANRGQGFRQRSANIRQAAGFRKWGYFRAEKKHAKRAHLSISFPSQENQIPFSCRQGILIASGFQNGAADIRDFFRTFAKV